MQSWERETVYSRTSFEFQISFTNWRKAAKNILKLCENKQKVLGVGKNYRQQKYAVEKNW